MSRLASSVTASISDTADRFDAMLVQVQEALEDAEQDILANRGLALSLPAWAEDALAQQDFLGDQQKLLTGLRDELSRSKQRIQRMALRYRDPEGRYDFHAIIDRFQQTLADGTAETKQEVVRLLVDQIVVDQDGRLDIYAKFPFGQASGISATPTHS